jgi:hypothetical protein
MERLWFARINRDLAQKRTLEEAEHVLDSWGRAKARLNSQLVRKHEVMHYANNFPCRDYCAPSRFRTLTRAQTRLRARARARTKTQTQARAHPRTQTGTQARAQLQTDAGSRVGEEELTLTQPARMQTTREKTTQPDPYLAIYQGDSSSEADDNDDDEVFLDLRSSHNRKTNTGKARARARGRTRQQSPQVIDLRTEAEAKKEHKFSDIDKYRIDYIRKTVGKLIGATDDHMTKPAAETQTTLAPYDPQDNPSPDAKPTMKLQPQPQAVPITLSVYQQPRRSRSNPRTGDSEKDLCRRLSSNRERFRTQQREEINRIKDRLAKEGIPCSSTVLDHAILIPEDYPAMRMTAEHFLPPGSRLLVNPFARLPHKKPVKGKKSH